MADFDPYYKWLGIPPKDQPPHHYRLLGIPDFESDADVIQNGADGRMAMLKSFATGEHASLTQKLLNEVAQARVCLLSESKKRAYDEGLRKQQKQRARDAEGKQPTRRKRSEPVLQPRAQSGSGSAYGVAGSPAMEPVLTPLPTQNAPGPAEWGVAGWPGASPALPTMSAPSRKFPWIWVAVGGTVVVCVLCVAVVLGVVLGTFGDGTDVARGGRRLPPQTNGRSGTPINPPRGRTNSPVRSTVGGGTGNRTGGSQPSNPSNNSSATQPEVKKTPLEAAIADLQAERSFTRSAAASRLASIPVDEDHRAEVAKLLLALLHDSDTFCRRNACQALGVWGTTEQVPELLPLLKTSDSFTRAAVIKVLAKFPDERSAEPLAERLVDFFDRREAAEALKAIGPLAETAVAKKLQHTDNSVRSAACGVLQEIGTRASVVALQYAATGRYASLKSQVDAAVAAILDRDPGEIPFPLTPPSWDGFEALLVGSESPRWKGELARPLDDPEGERRRMNSAQLARAQQAADKVMLTHWKLENGVLECSGKGRNVLTVDYYSNFELFVEWKIEAGADSGIYLRGCPQVQIWDNELGSGGLYNNRKHRATPLEKADNPVGEWNSMYVRMVGQLVTVRLNGKLVVDDEVMENHWARNKPVYDRGPIALQSQTGRVWFRNLYIRDLSR